MTTVELSDSPVRAFDVTVASADGTVYLVRGRDAFRVNQVALEIWGSLEGELTLIEIAQALTSRFNVASQKAQSDTLDFCNKLLGRELIILE